MKIHIDIPENIKAEVKIFIGKKYLQKETNKSLSNSTKMYLIDTYKNYGFKVIARELDISYTQCRRLFINWLKIKTRTGYNVCLETTKKFRSQRVQGKNNPWYDWSGKGKIKNSRGIQGYYITKIGKKVWLRSTWEYIYAKWLDTNNIDWKYEGKQFVLSNGESYRPDFIINKNNEEYIIELKGYFKDRVYKVDMLRKEYPNTKIIIIDNIKDYTKNYRKELKLWKQTIKLNG